jgi:hypothetical protein
VQPEVLLRKILDTANAREGGYVLALDNDTLAELPATLTTAHATWSVKRPSSELDLRHMLWKANGAPLLAVLPPALAADLAVDLKRSAQLGRIVHLEPVEVLTAVLGIQVQGVDDLTLQLALEHLPQLEGALQARTQPSILDRRLLDALLLEACIGKPLRDYVTGGAVLAEWLGSATRWNRAVNEMVRRTLPRELGPEGAVLEWALEPADDKGPSNPKARRRLEAVLVRGLLFAIDTPENLPSSLWGELDAMRGARSLDLGDETLMGVVAGMAVDALTALGNKANPYLTAAESIARKDLPPALYRKSKYLPLGLETACDALAERMAAGHSVASVAIDELRAHHAAGTAADKIDVLNQMARLSRWLEAAAQAAEANDVLAHVQHYQRHGAFADLTAAHLRRVLGRTTSYHPHANGLLKRWEAARNRQNEAFARLLAANYVKHWHAEGVVPLHRLWQEAVLPRLARARVFVVVMDGCSYPVFLDLVEQLRAGTDEALGLELVHALRSGTEGDDALGRAEGISALAPLPSITSHARGSIFLGELPADPWMAETVWREEGERRTDPARFKQNQALGSRSRRLFLKGDLTDGGAALVQALAGDDEVVATVFNAVDDLIGGHATGVLTRLAPADIAGFLPALRAAFRAGREVLITADHGHTLFLDKALCVGAGTSARWCELGARDSVPEGFMEIDVEGLGGPKGRKAFAWKLGVYRGKPHVGFHGGVGIEELVVPMAWLKQDGSEADQPAWWHGSTTASATNADALVVAAQAAPVLSTPSPEKTKGKAPAKPKVAPGQADLFDRRRTLAAHAKVTGSLPLPDSVLAQLDEGERATLGVLMQNGSAKATEIGKVQQRSAARVNGYMTQLKRKLHKLDVECFDVERLPSGESQYTWTGGKG